MTFNECNLPDLVTKNAEWEDDDVYKERAYVFYKKDLIDHRVTFLNTPVYVVDDPADASYNSFEHIVSKQSPNNKKYRKFCIERCERIRWIRAIIEQSLKCCDIRVFKKYDDRSKKDRVYIWCKQKHYMIILEDRDQFYFLLTAFVVDDDNEEQYASYYDKYRYSAFAYFYKKDA